MIIYFFLSNKNSLVHPIDENIHCLVFLLVKKFS